VLVLVVLLDFFVAGRTRTTTTTSTNQEAAAFGPVIVLVLVDLENGIHDYDQEEGKKG
jgi:hypothetical protein